MISRKRLIESKVREYLQSEDSPAALKELQMLVSRERTTKVTPTLHVLLSPIAVTEGFEDLDSLELTGTLNIAVLTSSDDTTQAESDALVDHVDTMMRDTEAVKEAVNHDDAVLYSIVLQGLEEEIQERAEVVVLSYAVTFRA